MLRMEEFIKKMGDDEWEHIEWFMEIDGEKVKKSIKEMAKMSKDKIIFYNFEKCEAGRLIEKGPEGQVRFCTYTVLDNMVTFFHETYHASDGTFLGGKIYNFDIGYTRFPTVKDAVEYSEKMLPIGREEDYDLKY